MNPNLEQAIIEFLANEFKLKPGDILPDTDFSTDLGLDQNELSDLIDRMQDALEFVIAEDKTEDIKTVGDLFNSLHSDTESNESS